MSKVITYSRQYPQGHPMAGKPTWFVEKIIADLVAQEDSEYYTDHIKRLRDLGYLQISTMNELAATPYFRKGHTVRAGHRFKAGDTFSPRIWSGKPYRSKQIVLGPDVTITKVWSFQTGYGFGHGLILLDGKEVDIDFIREVAKNDGLTLEDFWDWIIAPSEAKDFDGQIICWNSDINY